MLEEQLSLSRNRTDKVLELESEIIKYKQLLNDMALVRNLLQKVLQYYKSKKRILRIEYILYNKLKIIFSGTCC